MQLGLRCPRTHPTLFQGLSVGDRVRVELDEQGIHLTLDSEQYAPLLRWILSAMDAGVLAEEGDRPTSAEVRATLDRLVDHRPLRVAS